MAWLSFVYAHLIEAKKGNETKGRWSKEDKIISHN
jgi:hypothetical protein